MNLLTVLARRLLPTIQLTEDCLLQMQILLHHFFTQAELQLSNPMTDATIYTITANHIPDCKSNTIGAANSIQIVGYPLTLLREKWLLMRYCSIPRSGASDYTWSFITTAIKFSTVQNYTSPTGNS